MRIGHRRIPRRSEDFLLIGCALCLALALVGGYLLTPSVSVQAGKIQVLDGDTLRFHGETYRLYGVDCPESRQEFGQEATQITREALSGHIEFKRHGQDKYGRTVAVVVLDDGQTLQEHLIRSGGAWVYWDFCKTPRCLYWQWLEWEAQREKRGLWKYKNSLQPWKWRQLHH